MFVDLLRCIIFYDYGLHHVGFLLVARTFLFIFPTHAGPSSLFRNCFLQPSLSDRSVPSAEQE